VTPTYGLVGSFRNTTFLTVEPSATVTVLEAEVLGQSFGPVYSREWRLGSLIPPIQLHTTAFDVPFGAYTGQTVAFGQWPALASPAPGAPPPPPPYDPWTNASAVPEPGTLALAAGGLLLLAAAARRREGRA
jgi:hypothetical protein